MVSGQLAPKTCDAGAGVVVPSLVALSWVNWPFCTPLSTMVVLVGVSEPAAQLGLQSRTPDVPVPVAVLGPQLDQVMPVIWYVASPLSAIELGRTPL